MRVCVTQLDGVNTMNALPLAAGLVVASARLDPALADRAELEIVIGNDPPERVVDELAEPDVVAMSIYLWNERYSLEVARRVRERHPGCLILAGGPAVPTRPDAAEAYLRRHPQLDLLVLGEGEVTFREVLKAQLAENPLSDVLGIAYRDGAAEVRVAPPRPRLADFSSTASPFLDGTFDALCARYPARYPDHFAVALVETNRGCPFTCTFCSSGLDVHNRVHELPLDRVLRELEWIVERGFPYLFITDLNFGIRPRDAAIAEHLAELKGRTGYPGYAFFYTTKNARARHMAPVETLLKAGIGCQVALSMQSFDESVLAAVRRSNIPAKRWLELRELCDARGITTYNELILGLPGQTYTSFASSVVTALSPLPRDSFYIYLCRVLPNTEMGTPEHRRRFGIETRHCLAKPADARFDAPVDEVEEIVVGLSSMPTERWRRAYTFGYLVSACFNQRLLDLVIRYLQAVLGVDMRAYFDHLRDGLEASRDGSVLAAVQGVFDRYLASILSGGPVLLPVEGAGQTHREVSEAVVAVALERPDAFYAEVCALTVGFLTANGPTTEAASQTIHELFGYQRFVTPAFGEDEPIEACFGFDWVGYWQARPVTEPEPAITDLRFEPPGYAGYPSFRGFIENHLAAVRLKASTGEVTAFRPG